MKMIKQPKRASQNVNDSFYKAETERIRILNEKFFGGIKLTVQENTVLVWLCGLDYRTFDAMVSVLEKVKEMWHE